jgi:hypothetical protein
MAIEKGARRSKCSRFTHSKCSKREFLWFPKRKNCWAIHLKILNFISSYQDTLIFNLKTPVRFVRFAKQMGVI